MSNKRDLLELLKSVKSLLYKYNDDTEYHHVVYHTLLRRFMVFCQGDYSNSEYKKRFKEQIEVLEAYNGGGPIREQPGIYGARDHDTGTGRKYRR